MQGKLANLKALKDVNDLRNVKTAFKHDDGNVALRLRQVATRTTYRWAE
jgi:hypothetical protein